MHSRYLLSSYYVSYVVTRTWCAFVF